MVKWKNNQNPRTHFNEKRDTCINVPQTSNQFRRLKGIINISCTEVPPGFRTNAALAGILQNPNLFKLNWSSWAAKQCQGRRVDSRHLYKPTAKATIQTRNRGFLLTVKTLLEIPIIISIAFPHVSTLLFLHFRRDCLPIDSFKLSIFWPLYTQLFASFPAQLPACILAYLLTCLYAWLASLLACLPSCLLAHLLVFFTRFITYALTAALCSAKNIFVFSFYLAVLCLALPLTKLTSRYLIWLDWLILLVTFGLMSILKGKEKEIKTILLSIEHVLMLQHMLCVLVAWVELEHIGRKPITGSFRSFCLHHTGEPNDLHLSTYAFRLEASSTDWAFSEGGFAGLVRLPHEKIEQKTQQTQGGSGWT